MERELPTRISRPGALKSLCKSEREKGGSLSELTKQGHHHSLWVEKVLVFSLWEHEHMREPARWGFLIHQNEKCVLLLKSTWQPARGFFPSVQTKDACKQKLLQKFSEKSFQSFNFLFFSMRNYPEIFHSRAAFAALPLFEPAPGIFRRLKMFFPFSNVKDVPTGLSLALSLSLYLFQLPAIS